MEANDESRHERDPEALARVLVRVREVWEEPAATTWLSSQNAHLSGARPVDLVSLGREQEVLEALDATAAGGYA